MTELGAIIQRFEADMQFDAHSHTIKLGRSQAARILIKMGRVAPPFIAAYLETHPPNEQLGIHVCWGMLINDIAIDIQSNQRPIEYDDTRGWIAWAKREGVIHGSS